MCGPSSIRLVIWILVLFSLGTQAFPYYKYIYYCKLNYEFIDEKDIMQILLNLSTETSLDPNLLYAIIKVESNFDVCATSPKGAIGLMQILPSTAKLFEPGISIRELYNPVVNIRIGSFFFKALLDYYKSVLKDTDIALFASLLAYNAGPYRDRFPEQAFRYSCKVIRLYAHLSKSEAKYKFIIRLCKKYHKL